jgi:hypothetical protein
MLSPNTKSSWVEPVTLAGRAVRLEPLGDAHLEGLCEVGLDDYSIMACEWAEVKARLEAKLAATA